MRTTLATVVLATAFAMPLTAQEHEMDHTDPVTDIQPIQDQFIGFMLRAAEQVPESDYSFAPVDGVRTMGQLFGHVANASFSICSTTRGEANPNSANHEEGTKASITAGLAAARDYCGAVAKWGADHHHDKVSLFGMNGSVTWALAFNAAHNAEHYGNVVTYMRIKGMVPPSSQR